MDINGIPLHPLVVHAAVVLGPLAALFGLAYGLVPRWRWALRWPLAVLTLMAVGSAILAASSGEALLEARPGLEESNAVEEHEEAGEMMRNLMLLFTVVAGLAVWRLGGPSALASGKGARQQHGATDMILAGLLLLASVALLVGTFLAGHSGASAVWG